MKKLFIAAAALFIFASAARAQNFKWGVDAGVNYGKVTGSTYFNRPYTLGFQAGLYAQYQFNDLVGIQPELLFNEINAKPKYTGTHTMSAGYFDMNGSVAPLNFLSLPVLVRFNLSKSFSLQVGPQFDMLMQNITYVYETPTDAFKKLNVGGTVAAQFDLGNWLIYGRCNIGITNINNCTVDEKWHTQAFQLGLGYNLSHFLQKHK
jgi:opacity protein-like surface antigen